MPLKRQRRALGLVRGGRAQKKRAQPAGDALDLARAGWASSARIMRTRGASAKGILGAGDENTGAAGLAPVALVGRSRRAVIVVTGEELARVEPQFAMEEMQLFYS